MKERGTVKWFNPEKGYGFITRDSREKDCFVHWSAVDNPRGGHVKLEEGERVEFNVVVEEKGPKAANVSRIAG